MQLEVGESGPVACKKADGEVWDLVLERIVRGCMGFTHGHSGMSYGLGEQY